MKFIFRFNQGYIITLFQSWITEEQRKVPKTEEFDYDMYPHTKNFGPSIERGVCLGLTMFIFKMLYTKEAYGGLWYAHKFYAINFDKTTPKEKAEELLTVFEKISVFKQQIYEYLRIGSLRKENIDNVKNIINNIFQEKKRLPKMRMPLSGLFPNIKDYDENFKIIPASFWFFIEEFYKTIFHDDAKSMFFPFIVEIMNIQKRFHTEHNNLHLREFYLKKSYDMAYHSLSKEYFIGKEFKQNFMSEYSTILNLDAASENADTLATEQLAKLVSFHIEKNKRVATSSAETEATKYKMIYFCFIDYQMNLRTQGSFGKIIDFLSKPKTAGHSISFWALNEFNSERQRYEQRSFLFEPNAGLIEIGIEKSKETAPTPYNPLQNCKKVAKNVLSYLRRSNSIRAFGNLKVSFMIFNTALI